MIVTVQNEMSKQELARRVHDVCYLEGHFVLRSGQAATFYFDKYMFEADPRLLGAIARHLASLVPVGTQLLAGLELGGAPISTALSLQTGLQQVLVRKKAKTYGTAKLAEGPDVAGRNVLIVEDVITTGGQVALSARELRERGALVRSVLCAIDRRSVCGGEGPLAEAGLETISLFTLADFLPPGEAGQGA